MLSTMTWVGLDVHARSVHAAAIDAETGELRRARLGGASSGGAVPGGLRAPVRAVYEAGPTGFGLARAGAAAGVEMLVVAPGKTPRGAAERVKTDQRDAELLVRLLMAGSLRAIHVPSEAQEAARDLVRAREAVRQDLMRCRHRVSKLLLRHGRVWPAERSTWTVAHRDWLAAQRFSQPALQLAYIDALAAVDGLLARRAVLEQQLAQIATEPEFWPIVARLRAFRGVDTLTALGLLTEVGALRPLRAATPAGSLAGTGAERQPKRAEHQPRRDHQDRLQPRPATAGGSRLALRSPAPRRPDPPQPPGRPARPRSCTSPGARSTACTRPTPGYAHAASPPTSPPSPPPASSPASSGPRPRHSTRAAILSDRRQGQRGRRHARKSMGSPTSDARS